jgi:anti-sigma regulatory factor (Ser/Thr protein kinase)
MPPSGVHTHQALIYRDDREYLDGLARFLSPAVAPAEPVALALPESKLRLVRDQLDDIENKELLDMAKVGRNPGRILSVIERLREEHGERTLHYVGEPIWPGRTPEEIREAVRHEALINLALANTPTRVLCPYDAVGLDAAVLASAKRTHPEIVEQGTTHASCCYREAIPPECELPLSAPPDDAASYLLEEGALSALRAAVREHGRDAGFGGDVVEDLQIVANELATNALRHGAPLRQLTIWRTCKKVICQVENEGAISDPLAGRRSPEPRAGHGMGLWIVHQLSDLVEMRDGTRTTVRAHLVA